MDPEYADAYWGDMEHILVFESSNKMPRSDGLAYP